VDTAPCSATAGGVGRRKECVSPQVVEEGVRVTACDTGFINTVSLPYRG
jgi:hypothetical protein